MLTELQYRILRRISPGAPETCDGSAYRNRSKLQVLLGDELTARCVGRTVIDFGCGEGLEAVELARSGAQKVIGVDLREDALDRARRHAAEAGVASICEFATLPAEPAGIIVSLDAFEHFEDVPAILRTMSELLSPSGEVLASFGPTWYHPLGGHLFSVFPWAHLLFTEEALIRWRSDFKSDGATRFREVAGGLNQLTIRQFERYVAASPFDLAAIETVPIRNLRPLHNRWTRELTTATVRCRLVKR